MSTMVLMSQRAAPTYVIVEEPECPPFTVAELVEVNADAALLPEEIAAIERLAVGTTYVVGGGSQAATTFRRVS